MQHTIIIQIIKSGLLEDLSEDEKKLQEVRQPSVTSPTAHTTCTLRLVLIAVTNFSNLAITVFSGY